MVATTFMWVSDQKVVITLLIYTVEASNKDQALLIDIRKRDMPNNITIIMTFMINTERKAPKFFFRTVFI